MFGRDRERAVLRELLDDTIAGRGGMVLINGEAGIGKTTLVDDLVNYAEECGCTVLSGGCYDFTATPPYGPWIEAIRGYTASAPKDGPDVRSWFGDPDELERVGSQAALFEGARALFADIAHVQPLIIVLEDLHWSDAASLDVLRYLGRSLIDGPVLMVATYRDDELTRRHPLYQLLPVLIRETAAHRIHLNRLDLPDVNAFIARRYDMPHMDQRRLAEHLWQRSEGNPFYIEEFLQGLEEDQILRHGEPGWELRDVARAQIPSLLRSVTERRLERLDEGIRGLLEIAAIIGHHVSYTVWLDVSGAAENELVEAVRTALQARLVEETPDHDGIEFRHALVRETLYGGVIGVNLQLWHRKIAEVLLRHSSAHPDEVAWHFVEANDDRQTEWLLRAGERAEEGYAWTTAVARYETALRSMGEHDADEVERGWLLSRISDLMRYSDHRLAMAYAEEARRVGEDIGDHWLVALAGERVGFYRAMLGDLIGGADTAMVACAALDTGMRAYWHGSDNPGWRRSLDRVNRADLDASAYLSTVAGGEGVRLNMRWGTVVGFLSSAGRLAEAREIGETALPVSIWALENVDLSARTLGYADVLGALASTYALLGQTQALRELTDKSCDAYRRYGHHTMVVNARSRQIHEIEVAYFSDEPKRREQLLQEVNANRERARGAYLGVWIVPGEAVAALVAGQWEKARETAEQGLLEGPSWFHVQSGFQTVLASLDVAQGRIREAWARIHEVLPDGDETVKGRATFRHAIQLQHMAASIALGERDVETARSWLDARDRWMDWSGAVLGLAEGHLGWAHYHREVGDLEQARRYAEQAFNHAANPRQPLALIAAYRFLGQLGIDEEQLQDSKTYLTTSLELAQACEAPFEQAQTLIVMAELAAKTEESDEARRLLARVRNICEPLGAQPTLERADQIEALLPRRRASSEEYPAGLTQREVEVLRLVAEGMTDAEVAEELFISPRTVSQHLRNAFSKLGVNSRVEATRFAVEEGLVSRRNDR